ncbi:hypothetical protein BCV71DRAFT_154063, partial [Rhizopus microsporus]
NCSSCHAPLPADSRYRTCQQEGRQVRRRGRPRVEPSQTIPAAYISQLYRLRPLNLGRMDKECLHCHALH